MGYCAFFTSSLKSGRSWCDITQGFLKTSFEILRDLELCRDLELPAVAILVAKKWGKWVWPVLMSMWFHTTDHPPNLKHMTTDYKINFLIQYDPKVSVWAYKLSRNIFAEVETELFSNWFLQRGFLQPQLVPSAGLTIECRLKALWFLHHGCWSLLATKKSKTNVQELK